MSPEQLPAVAPSWTLSIVSHGHAREVERLLADLARHLDPARHALVLTLNLGAREDIRTDAWPGAVRILRNPQPRSFSANHNAALLDATSPWVAAIDPDLQLGGNPFPALEAWLERPEIGVVAPQVRSPDGVLEDSGRRYLDPLSLARRRLLGRLRDYPEADQPREVDWLAGLFMTFRREVFSGVGGFDERYRLYCEDAELCVRIRNRDLQVWQLPSTEVIHVARRASLKDRQHLIWHCQSLLRYWSSATFWRSLGRRVRRCFRTPASGARPRPSR